MTEKKLKICILSSFDEDNDVEYQDFDAPYDPSYYYPDAEFDTVHLKRGTSNVVVLELIRSKKYDLFFALVDGAWDEAKAGIEVIQLLEKSQVPFIGCNSSCYDITKEDMKKICYYFDISTPDFCFCFNDEDIEEALMYLSFPLIVKHFNGGNSVGMTKDSKVHTPDALRDQCKRFIQNYGGALVEQFIEGEEYSALIVERRVNGKSEACVLDPIEVVFPEGESFKHFDLKWKDHALMSGRQVENETAKRKIKEMCQKMFEGCLGRSFARCDIRYDPKTEEAYMLEINFNCSIFFLPEEWGTADIIMGYSDTLLSAPLPPLLSSPPLSTLPLPSAEASLPEFLSAPVPSSLAYPCHYNVIRTMIHTALEYQREGKCAYRVTKIHRKSPESSLTLTTGSPQSEEPKIPSSLSPSSLSSPLLLPQRHSDLARDSSEDTISSKLSILPYPSATPSPPLPISSTPPVALRSSLSGSKEKPRHEESPLDDSQALSKGGKVRYGYGMVATRDLQKGDVIQKGEREPKRIASLSHIKATFTSLEMQWFHDYAYPTSDTGEVYQLWGTHPNEWAPINHSCEPNSILRGLDIVARREIKRNEEITIDYVTFVDENSSAFDCCCGAYNCRRVVSGKDWKNPSLQEKYKGAFADSIQQKISKQIVSQ